ncbi:MAG: hypothetical protein H6716_29650, partial [Polyangiaceae bacterium]|nr:hypothetical protein [Polyangiaceae bacterium]
MITNDYWTVDLEHLGGAEAGDKLVDVIIGCRPPYSVCVQGKWGAGKTSLMRYAMARLGGQPMGLAMGGGESHASELPAWLKESWEALVAPHQELLREQLARRLDESVRARFQRDDALVMPVWFNPWNHRGGDLVVALLQELRAQMTFFQQAPGFAQKLLGVSVEAGLRWLDKMIDGLAEVRKDWSAAGTRRHEARSDLQRLNLQFEEAVVRLVAPRSGVESGDWVDAHGRSFPVRRLVIFIDDLDRCSETEALLLLDAIKLYLQTSHCVFVFGLDVVAIRTALMRDGRRSEEEAKAYVDKLFQATVFVPVPKDRSAFLRKLLEASALPEGGDQYATLIGLVDELVEPNPRRLKNFVNGLSAAWCAEPDEKGSLETFELFVLLHYLREAHPDVFRFLAYDPTRLGDLTQALESGDQGLGLPKTTPSQVFFRSVFRHAFALAFEEGSKDPSAADHHELATRFRERLDRHRSDAAFVARWI